MIKIVENNKVVGIDELRANKYNPKLDYKDGGDLQKEFDKIKESLKYHGQVEPIQVRREKDVEGYEIVNGYHRWQAMKDLGFDKVEIKDLGLISLEEAIKITLSMEELSIPLDVIETAKLIKQIKDSEAGLEGLPYLEKEISEKIKMLEFDWDFSNKAKEEQEGLDLSSLKIVVTLEQREIILKTLRQVMTQNDVKEGRALELICGDYLAGH